MRKTIRERLAEGEQRISIDQEDIEVLSDVVPHITLQYRLQQLEKAGVVTTRQSPAFADSRRWTYEGRDIHFVHSFTGEPEWTNGPDGGFKFPHDVAVDLESNVIIAFART